MTRFIACVIMLLLGFYSCQVDSSGIASGFEFEVHDYFLVDEARNDFTAPNWDNSSFFEARADSIASLGRVLFYDKRLSKNNTISCESCHQQSRAFADGEQFSVGLQNGITTRSSMSLVNSVYQRRFFWESKTAFSSFNTGYGFMIPVLDPISNHIEMGMNDIDELVRKLEEIDIYQELFESIYDGKITDETIGQALQLFIQSIISTDTKYDRALEDSYSYTVQEQLGLDIFNGKALCGQCHKGHSFVSTWRNTANIGLDMEYVDQGLGDGHFKIPTLRNIALTGPYMHDGRFETLAEVIDHYVNRVTNHPELDWTLKSNDIDLSNNEQEALLAFLHTLTDYHLLQDQRYSSPF